MDVPETRLTDAFVALADTLVRDFDLTGFLHMLADTCVDVLDATAAGILLVGPSGTLHVVASSGERIRLLELFELQNEQGPCSDAHRTGRAVHEPDLRSTQRWPIFSARAVEEGFASVDAVPLRLRRTRLGALNLLNEAPGGLSEQERRTAQALADVATIGLLQERAARESELSTEHLRYALDARVTIEQAKGVLAAQGDLSVGDAFERLRGHAHATSTMLSEVADLVVRGELTLGDLR